MADQQTERFLRNQRERHLEQARVAARRIQDRVANILRDLEAGRPPSEFSLVPDAVELEKRSAALDAIRDTVGIYEADGQ
jgi:hypothetical protein